MPTYRIRIDQEIDAETPEEAADKFREWLRKTDASDFYSPFIEVTQWVDAVLDMREAIPMDIAVFQWWEETKSNFMHAFVDHFDEDPQERDEENLLEGTGFVENKAGWYSRLSAPGHMDCTEWDGPHETQYLAMESLFNMYGE